MTINAASRKLFGIKQRVPENSLSWISSPEAFGEAEILFYRDSDNPTEIGAGSGGWSRFKTQLHNLQK